MFDYLTEIKPALTDFILLALLQMLMHVLTVVEVGRGDTRLTSTADVDRTSAATWSFAGVLITLVAGIAAKAIRNPTAEAWALAVPLFFISRWAFFHWRISKLLDGSILEAELHDIYGRAIIKVFDESGVEDGLTPREVASRLLPYLQQAKPLYDNAGLFKRLVPVSVGSLFDRLLPTPDNLIPILAALTKKKSLRMANGKYYRAVSPES